jgi:uncharacterized protein YhaN
MLSEIKARLKNVMLRPGINTILESDVIWLIKELEAKDKQITELEEKLARYYGVIRLLEKTPQPLRDYAIEGIEYWGCPICHMSHRHPHRKECQLGQLLKELDGGRE